VKQAQTPSPTDFADFLPIRQNHIVVSSVSLRGSTSLKTFADSLIPHPERREWEKMMKQDEVLAMEETATLLCSEH